MCVCVYVHMCVRVCVRVCVCIQQCSTFADPCIADPRYCNEQGTCKFDSIDKKPMCFCQDNYEGDHCETRTGKLQAMF